PMDSSRERLKYHLFVDTTTASARFTGPAARIGRFTARNTAQLTREQRHVSEVRVHTPGVPWRPHPWPQETRPLTTQGPPGPPVQESTPPRCAPAPRTNRPERGTTHTMFGRNPVMMEQARKFSS